MPPGFCGAQVTPHESDRQRPRRLIHCVGKEADSRVSAALILFFMRDDF